MTDGQRINNFDRYKRIILYGIIGIVAIAIGILALNNNNHNSNNNIKTLSYNSVESSRLESIRKFQEQFCGLNTQPISNEFVTEYKLPGICEMPLGIAADNDNKIWFISTKNGTLDSYNIDQQKFGKEISIPIWKSRQNPIDSSQVWDVKLDRTGANIWFTDEKQNAIWKYNKSANTFEFYKVPKMSDVFGTIYPVSIDFDLKGNIYFIGIRSTSLWVGDITKMKNGTSDGISEIPLPTGNFAGIDQDLISTGSVALDNKNNAIWISMLAFEKKGQILRYDEKTKTFKSFEMPAELSSPVGTVVDDLGNLWVTDHGTSIFYKLDPLHGNITKFITSRASPRIFGGSETPERAYTLPYWIKKGQNNSIWFNEHTGNKIARFDSVNETLVEYWIPSQDKFFGLCQSSNQTCGIANVLQFTVGQNNQIWFTEWSENKIGRIDAQKQLPFSVYLPTKEITLKKGDTAEIKVNVSSSSNQDMNITMISSGTFTPTGNLGNSTGSFSEESFLLNARTSKQISFIFTPSSDMQSGIYTLMIGGENNVVSYLKAVKVKIT